MIYVYIAAIIILLLIQYKIYKKIITPFTCIAVPYLIIIPMNNYWAVNIGFHVITVNVMIMIISGLILFFVGSIIANNRRQIVSTDVVAARENSNTEFELYNFRGMMKYAFFVSIIALIRVAIGISRGGLGYFASSAGEGFMTSGIVGHLLLSLYPIIPILLYYWLNNKKKVKYLIAIIIPVMCLFLSFVKYHSIALLVLCFMFVAFKNRKYVKVGSVAIVALAIFVFVFNYYLDFRSRGVLNNINQSFYMLHLWKYIGGGLIHDGEIFVFGVNNAWSGLYKIGRLFCALPNMILYPFFGYKPLFTSIASDLGFSAVSDIGESGNTVDFIGYMFPSDKSVFGFVIFGLTLIGLGYISTKLFNKAYDDLNNYSRLCTALSFTVFFCFFSFFGVYGALSTPWEIIVWSIIMPNLFYEKANVKFRIR